MFPLRFTCRFRFKHVFREISSECLIKRTTSGQKSTVECKNSTNVSHTFDGKRQDQTEKDEKEIIPGPLHSFSKRLHLHYTNFTESHVRNTVHYGTIAPFPKVARNRTKIKSKQKHKKTDRKKTLRFQLMLELTGRGPKGICFVEGMVRTMYHSAAGSVGKLRFADTTNDYRDFRRQIRRVNF